MKSKLISLITLLLLSFNSYSWNAAGHMVIAAIAWDNLSANDQEKVLAILENHPDAYDWSNDYNEVKDKLPRGQYYMMRASTWADEIRNAENPNSQFHRGEWHYITYMADFDDGFDINNPKELDDEGKGDVVWAINHSSGKISNSKTPDNQKAMYLAWMIHLIGDLHQPLHVCSMYDNDYQILNDADGDRGGNQIYVTAFKSPTKLHSFMDSRLGTSRREETLLKKSQSFQNANPKKASMLTTNVSDWSKESFKLAVEEVHLNGELKYSIDKYYAPKTPNGYTDKMKKLSQNQAALAGYRLADSIGKL